MVVLPLPGARGAAHVDGGAVKTIAPGSGAMIVGANVPMRVRIGPLHFARGEVVLREHLVPSEPPLQMVVGWTPPPPTTNDFAAPSAIVKPIDAKALRQHVQQGAAIMFPPEPFDRAHLAVWVFGRDLPEAYQGLVRAIPREHRRVVTGSAGTRALLVPEGQVPTLRDTWAERATELAIEAGRRGDAAACLLHAQVAFALGVDLVPERFALLAYAFDAVGDRLTGLATRGCARLVGEAFAANVRAAYDGLALVHDLPPLPAPRPVPEPQETPLI